MTGLAPLSGALNEYLDESGLAESLARLGAVDEWAGAVGPRIAQVTQAIEVRGDVLVVEVASSAWINELSMMRGLVLERVNACRNGPPVQAVRFRLAERADGIRGRDRRTKTAANARERAKTAERPKTASGRTNGVN